MVGPLSDGYRPTEKTMKPHFLEPIANEPSFPEIGDNIIVKSWDGRDRETVVLHVLKPLFLAECTILSGQRRQTWFDPTRIDGKS